MTNPPPPPPVSIVEDAIILFEKKLYWELSLGKTTTRSDSQIQVVQKEQVSMKFNTT